MLSSLHQKIINRLPIELPGRGGGRKAPPLRDLRPPGPSGHRALSASLRELHQSAGFRCGVRFLPLRGRRPCSARPPLRSGNPPPPLIPSHQVGKYARAESAVPGTDIKARLVSLAFSSRAVRASCRLMQRSCGSARHRRSAVRTSRPAHLRHRSSAVSLRLVYLRHAMPPGTACLPHSDVLRRYCSAAASRGYAHPPSPGGADPSGRSEGAGLTASAAVPRDFVRPPVPPRTMLSASLRDRPLRSLRPHHVPGAGDSLTAFPLVADSDRTSRPQTAPRHRKGMRD